MAAKHRIAVIPGDGIGQEVIPAALTVLEAVASPIWGSSSTVSSRRRSTKRLLEGGSDSH